MIDIKSVRADIAGIEQRVHFNNAGMSLMATPVYEAMLEYLALEQSVGGYEIAAERAEDTDNFYHQAALLLNCQPAEIAFFESASRAWQAFFYSLQFASGDRILTTRLDYGSNFVAFIQQAGRLGVEIDLVDCDQTGDLDLTQMQQLIGPRTKLISMSHIPTANGIINPAAKVGEMAKGAGIPFLLDACQSAGQIKVDVAEIGCTALSATGRKYLRGPRGTGLLYVQQDFLQQIEPACLDQHGVQLIDKDRYTIDSTAKRFENFEVGFAGRIALGRALQYTNDLGIENIEQRILSLSGYCREQLKKVPGARCGDTGARQGGIVMFDIEGHSNREIRAHLATHGIKVWVSNGSGGLVEYQKRGLDSLVRASLHYFNTEQEVDRMIDLLIELVHDQP